jgi:hypothetical protein
MITDDIYQLLDSIKYDSCFCALSEDIKTCVRDLVEEYEHAKATADKDYLEAGSDD